MKLMNTLAEAFIDVEVAYNVIDFIRDVDFADFLIGFITVVYFIVTIIFMLKAVKGSVVKVPVITSKISKHIDA